MINVQRYFLLLMGLTLVGIGVAYCIDPNLLLSRYELGVSGPSDDNMYRGAYGGLFITLGLAIAAGFRASAFRSTATIITLLFMGGFAIGRLASIAAVGMPHEQIVSLLVFEIVAVAACTWFLLTARRAPAGSTS